MPDLIRIVVVDDHPVFRSGLVQLLELEPRFEVVAEGATAAEAVDLAQRHEPDILLLDLSMADSGLDGIEPIHSASPDTKVVILTASDAAFDIQTALDRSVTGYLLKGSTGSEILEALETVASGQIYVSSRAMSRAIMASRGESMPRQGLLSKLSDREVTVLELIGQGLSNREIGQRLGIEEKSVKFHVTNIFTKLGVRNRVEAALIYNSRSPQDPEPHR